MNKKYNEHDINTCKIGNCLVSIGKIGAVVNIVLYLALIILYADTLSTNIILLLIGTPFIALLWLVIIGIGTYLNFTYDKLITLKEINNDITNNLNNINTTLEASNIIQVKDIRIRKD